jgi:4-hydroxy-tetrahydrodipicolinate synthase
MGFDELRRKLAGVVAIPVTPFDERGDLDEPAYAKVVRRMVDGGIEVLTPNGNTGEFYALTEPETRRAVDLTVHTAGDAATILAGVGHSTGDAAAAARYAEQAGAHAIMIHQPVHPYASADGWIDYNRAVADAVPELGVVLYLRSTRIGGEHVARLGELSPNVIAVKYAVPDPVRFASVARDAGLDRFVWLAGLAELSAPGYWVTGATGFTSGLANIDPSLSLRLLTALRTADYAEAMRVWESIRPFEALRAAGEAENNVSVVKEALAQLGVCRSDVRPPSHTLDEAGRSAVAAMLRGWALTSETLA